ncbi:alpha/beta hydrolase [Convivina intestini]|nr:alpha/beta hydrolase [Convivina intestini]
MTKQHHNDHAIQTAKISPVIFIPGSSATINRFDDLFTSINKQSKGTPATPVLKLQVNKDGSFTYNGKLATNNRQPFIVIGFEDNSDSYDNIKRQAKWLASAMNALQQTYHFRDFSAIGHSNGGLDWTEYLENYYNINDFHIKTLMTLGTPYNFSESSTTKQTAMLTDLMDNSDNLPTDLTVYSVAGSEDYSDDGIVPVQSVLSGKYIFQKQVKKYTQITVSGDNAEHSNLPENPEVVQLIQEYILNNKSNDNHSRRR